MKHVRVGNDVKVGTSNGARLALVATRGDLVCGLATPNPPTPFVGELGDPVADAAKLLTSAISPSAAGNAPIVTINGLPATVTTMPAHPLPGSAVPTQGRVPGGAAEARLAKMPLARQGDPSRVCPASAMSIIAGSQAVMLVEAPYVEDPTKATGIGSLLPTRSAYGPSSATHRMLSRCSPSRRAGLVPAEHIVVVGDPVNVVTGAVVSRATIHSLVSPAFEWTRSYDSAHSQRAGALGYGWSHDLEQAIWIEPGKVVLRDADGREIEFDTLDLPDGIARAGDVLFDPCRRRRLRAFGGFVWELRDGHRVRRFGPVGRFQAESRTSGLARLLTCSEPGRASLELHYDDAARLRSLSIEGRDALRFEYDAGRLVRVEGVTSGATPLASFTYSQSGDLEAATDQLGHRWSFEYVSHLLVRETNREGGSFHYGYDGLGSGSRCVRAWGDDGVFDRRFDYDPDRREVKVSDSLGQSTTFRYDALGLVTAIVDPIGNSTRYVYDDALRLIGIEHPDGTSHRATFDDRGNLIACSEPDGSAWTMRYDDRDRLLEGTDSRGDSWTYRYDDADRLAQIRAPHGGTIRFEPLGRDGLRISDTAGNGTSLFLDNHRRMTRLVTARGAAIGIRYDDWGRLASMSEPGTSVRHWHYDARHRLVALDREGSGTVRWRRDAEGFVIGEECPGGDVKIVRDRFGTIERIADETRSVLYVHDTERRLQAAHSAAGPSVELTRDAAGRVRAYALDDGRVCTVVRDPKSGRIVRLIRDDVSLVLAWTAAGFIESIELGSWRAAFRYRDDGLLLEAAGPGGTYRFERDARGGVTKQAYRDFSIETHPLDDRGRRRGLECGDIHISYLRGIDGEVERIVVAADRVFELALDAHGRLVEIDGRAPRKPFAAGIRETSSSGCDALLRPLDPTNPIGWDEDRPLRRGDELIVWHPDRGSTLATIRGTEIMATTPETIRPSLSFFGDEECRIHAQCFGISTSKDERLDGTAGLEQMLASTFRPRIWNPPIRPMGGDFPWDPGDWSATFDVPSPHVLTIDTTALMRACSPLPRPLPRISHEL